jgi:acyl phosphate:glycerol-3-phosphate acyltransferase
VPIASYLLTALTAYLLGSIPSGYLAGRARGIDIRTVGSKNMGATNVFRTVGKTLGILVLLADAFKGWAAVHLAAPFILQATAPGAAAPAPFTAAIIAAISAVLGHNYTCWLKFKGGKGIATSAGVMVALVPMALVVSLTVWIVLFVATRYVSVASIAAAAVLPFATWFTSHHSPTLTAITGVLGALAIYKHKANIQRLRAGTENRIVFRKKETAP